MLFFPKCVFFFVRVHNLERNEGGVKNRHIYRFSFAAPVSSPSSARDGLILSNESNGILPRRNHHLLPVTCATIQKLIEGTHGQRRQRHGRLFAALHPLMISLGLFEAQRQQQQQCRGSPSPSPPLKSLPPSALMSPNVLARRPLPFSLSHWSMWCVPHGLLSLPPAAPRGGGGKRQTDGRMDAEWKETRI